MKKAIFIILFILVIGGGLAFYLVNRGNQAREASADSLYDFSTVQRMDLSQKVDATGYVVAMRNTDILPAYEATVKQVFAKAGSPVKQGDLLMVLESPTLEDQWTQANSSRVQAKIGLDAAEKDLERMKILYAAQGTTIDLLEAAQTKVDTLQDQIHSADVKLAALARQPDGANFVAADHREIMIRAPFSGVVAWVYARPGDHALTSTVLASVAEAESPTVEVSVDESDIGSVHKGQKAVVTSSDMEQSEFKGVVTEVASIGKEASGVVTFLVRVKVDPGQTGLKPGMSVDLTIETESHPNILAVPVGAVTNRRGKDMVLLKTGQQVEYTRVETGFKSGGFIEIVSGLNAGDTVATPKPKDSSAQSQKQQQGGNNSPMRFGGFGR